jgi:predicted nucleic acid-binding protein
MLYIDSSVFLYAALSQEEIGNKARALLGEVQQGKKNACSSALTFDEIVWVVKRYRSMESAIVAGEAFLNFPNLKLTPVNGDLLIEALEMIKKYRLDPRDAIHAASAISEEAEEIVSTDQHFDGIAGLHRKPL